MTIKCEICSESFERDNNIYGTTCPFCGSFIKPYAKPGFITEAELKKEMLKAEMLEKLRNNMKGAK